jgi:hypothetical protein
VKVDSWATLYWDCGRLHWDRGRPPASSSGFTQIAVESDQSGAVAFKDGGRDARGPSKDAALFREFFRQSLYAGGEACIADLLRNRGE